MGAERMFRRRRCRARVAAFGRERSSQAGSLPIGGLPATADFAQRRAWTQCDVREQANPLEAGDRALRRVPAQTVRRHAQSCDTGHRAT
jgi:hypothetical protein